MLLISQKDSFHDFGTPEINFTFGTLNNVGIVLCYLRNREIIGTFECKIAITFTFASEFRYHLDLAYGINSVKRYVNNGDRTIDRKDNRSETEKLGQ